MSDPLDYPAPFDHPQMLAAFCYALGWARSLTSSTRSPRLRPEVLSALTDSARAAHVLATPDPSAAPALAFMTARMNAAGLTLYPAQMLAQFQAEVARLDAFMHSTSEALRGASGEQACGLLAQMLSTGRLPVSPELRTARPEVLAMKFGRWARC